MNAKQIVEFNIKKSKENIGKSFLKDELVIFFTRVVEDLFRHSNPNFYGRLKDFYLLLDPYGNIENSKEIFQLLKIELPETIDGLILNPEEVKTIKFFISGLSSSCSLKNKNLDFPKLEQILKKFIEEFFPNSCKIVEPYILGKLIAFAGGIKNLYRKPASTIQLIGAEKALFRHISKGLPGPKYGLIYYSRSVKKSKNKGKTARQLANKLAISLKQDYFQNFAQ